MERAFIIMTALIASAAPLAPRIAGTWRAGEIVVVKGGKLQPVDLPDVGLSDPAILPAGILVRFEAAKDDEGQPVSRMRLLTPWPKTACAHRVLKSWCGSGGIPPSEAVSWEFTLDPHREAGDTEFGAMGARPDDIVYEVLGNGRVWRGQFLAERGGKRLFSAVTLTPAKSTADGAKKIRRGARSAFQVFYPVTESK
jgi:hypothetical protein